MTTASAAWSPLGRTAAGGGAAAMIGYTIINACYIRFCYNRIRQPAFNEFPWHRKALAIIQLLGSVLAIPSGIYIGYTLGKIAMGGSPPLFISLWMASIILGWVGCTTIEVLARNEGLNPFRP